MKVQPVQWGKRAVNVVQKGWGNLRKKVSTTFSDLITPSQGKASSESDTVSGTKAARTLPVWSVGVYRRGQRVHRLRSNDVSPANLTGLRKKAAEVSSESGLERAVTTAREDKVQDALSGPSSTPTSASGVGPVSRVSETASHPPDQITYALPLARGAYDDIKAMASPVQALPGRAVNVAT